MWKKKKSFPFRCEQVSHISVLCKMYVEILCIHLNIGSIFMPPIIKLIDISAGEQIMKRKSQKLSRWPSSRAYFIPTSNHDDSTFYFYFIYVHKEYTVITYLVILNTRGIHSSMQNVMLSLSFDVSQRNFCEIFFSSKVLDILKLGMV